MTSNTQITTIDKEQGQCLAVAGSSYRILVSGKQTAGNYAVVDMLVPPGGGPGPHSHTDMQEMFYVVDGEVEFRMEGATYIAKKGSFVNIPLGGQVHRFKNKSTEIAHLLCTVVPAGLDDLFEEIGIPVSPGIFLPAPNFNAEDIIRLNGIAEKYGQKMYPPDFFDK